MDKNMSILEHDIREKIEWIHGKQMQAFGGAIKGYEIKEIFKRDGFYCVRFQNGDWYHYDLQAETWW